MSNSIWTKCWHLCTVRSTNHGRLPTTYLNMFELIQQSASAPGSSYVVASACQLMLQRPTDAAAIQARMNPVQLGPSQPGKCTKGQQPKCINSIHLIIAHAKHMIFLRLWNCVSGLLASERTFWLSLLLATSVYQTSNKIQKLSCAKRLNAKRHIQAANGLPNGPSCEHLAGRK